MQGVARMDESRVSSDNRVDARCLDNFSGKGLFGSCTSLDSLS